MGTDESQYRDEWAGLTGRSPSEVYVPAAIRDPETVTFVASNMGGKPFLLTATNVTRGPGSISGTVVAVSEVPES